MRFERGEGEVRLEDSFFFVLGGGGSVGGGFGFGFGGFTLLALFFLLLVGVDKMQTTKGHASETDNPHTQNGQR